MLILLLRYPKFYVLVCFEICAENGETGKTMKIKQKQIIF